MTDRASFASAIRAAPDDEAMRLVYADWLEEHGDPLAEFIRLQFELEPLRNAYHDPIRKRLAERELAMLKKHRAAWLGPVARVVEHWPAHVEFRRGLAELIALPAPLFLAHAEEVVQGCPALYRLVLYEVRGRGAVLAACPQLRALREITVADWMSEEDARSLATSPYLRELRCLNVWLSGPPDEAIIRALAEGPGLGRLQELRLYQLLGGAKSKSDRPSSQAKRLATTFNRVRGASIAEVVRVCDRTYPLCERVGYGIYAGRLPDERLAVVAGAPNLVVVLFDKKGRQMEVRHADLKGELKIRPKERYQSYDEKELMEVLGHLYGFTPALIDVRAFDTIDGLSVHLWSSLQLDILDVAAAEEDAGAMIHHWLRSGNFVIDWGNDYYAGPDGVIHSS